MSGANKPEVSGFHGSASLRPGVGGAAGGTKDGIIFGYLKGLCCATGSLKANSLVWGHDGMSADVNPPPSLRRVSAVPAATLRTREEEEALRLRCR